MSVDIRKLMQVDDKGTQRQYYPETNIEAINGLEDLLINGDYPELERTIYQFEGNVSETSQRLNRLKTEMTEMVEGEHGFLTPEKGFENYNDENKSDVSSQLQYVRIGPLCKVFGTVKNLETIRDGAEVVVTTIPAKLSVNVVDIVRGETRNGRSFRARVYNYNNPSFPNQITISSPQNGDGSGLDLSPGNWLNISLIAGIEKV